ncbi:F-box domain containing protein [Trema orientale]|uniref:F-box domain containing protein n=1 Tax=Trema orientale TaxID=63057 RepID=A0A2P5CCL6_TREOI|nr:F-box domain containing protein [Trema orientale]
MYTLGDELVYKILTKTSSVKELSAWKSVSKHWNALLQEPLFAEEHAKREGEHLLFLYDGFPNDISVYWKENFLLSSTHTFQSLSPTSTYQIHSSFDGLVCIAETRIGPEMYLIVLWNPATNKLRVCPPPTLQRPPMLELGFCKAKISHKVVRVTMNPDKESIDAEFFHSKTNRWTTQFDVFSPELRVSFSDSPAVCCWDGSINWALTKCVKGDRVCIIVTCHMEEESFSLSTAPEICQLLDTVLLGSSSSNLVLLYLRDGEVVIWTKKSLGDLWSTKKTVRLSPSFDPTPLWVENLLLIKGYPYVQDFSLISMSEPYEEASIDITLRKHEISRVLSHKESLISPFDI